MRKRIPLGVALFVFMFLGKMNAQEEPVEIPQDQDAPPEQVIQLPDADEAEFQPRILVMVTEIQGISKLESQTLSEYIRSEVDLTGAATGIELQALRKTLEELGIEEIGCTSDSCIFDLAQRLNATHTILWSLDKKEEKYRLVFRYLMVIDVPILKKQLKRKYKGDADGLVLAIQKSVWDLLEQAPPQDRFPEVEVTGIKLLIKQQVDRVGRAYVIGGVVLLSAGAIYLAAGAPEEPAGIGLPPDWPEP